MFETNLQIYNRSVSLRIFVSPVIQRMIAFGRTRVRGRALLFNYIRKPCHLGNDCLRAHLCTWQGFFIRPHRPADYKSAALPGTPPLC